MKITFISAALPPALDGIGDYTALLAAEMARTCRVSILTGEAAPAPIPGVTVETAFSVREPRSVLGLAARIAADPPDWVLLQYNPFSYGQRGRNLSLPAAMVETRRRCPGTRLAVMFHETYVPAVTLPFAVMALWQRWQFRRLARCADLRLFSMEVSARRFGRQLAGGPCLHLPVGSNLPRVPLCREEARGRLGLKSETLTLGFFGTAHVSRLLGRVRAAAESLAADHDLCVLYVGAAQAAVRDAVGGAARLIADGPASAAEASRRLAAMDMYLVPFEDGISTRRGTLMAGLQHGLATLGTRGCHTDRILREADGAAFLLADAGDGPGFAAQARRLADDPALRRSLGDAARRLYDSEFSWSRTAARLQQALAGEAD